MSFKIKYEKLLDGGFYMSLRKLGGARFSNFANTHHVATIKESIEEAFKEVGDHYNNGIVKEFAMTDENGDYVKVEGHADRFNVDPERKEDFEKKRDEFYQMERIFPHEKLPVKLVIEAGLTPDDYLQLKGIFAEK